MPVSKIITMLILISLMLAAGCGKKDITEVSILAENKYSCTYDGVCHEYILALPEHYGNAPLVMLLHGYGGSAEAFRTDIGFDRLANARGYVCVYVSGAPDSEDSTGAAGWNSGISDSKNKDKEFLVLLSEKIVKEYGLDAERVYVVGFSNGAFMAHRLAAEAGDKFAGIVSVAGFMPEKIWESSKNMATSFMQVSGTKDELIPTYKTKATNPHPPIEEVMDYYISTNGCEFKTVMTVGRNSTLEKYVSAKTNRQVWNLTIPDGRHSLPDERITGININELILDFFDACN